MDSHCRKSSVPRIDGQQPHLVGSEEGLLVNAGHNDRMHVQLFSQLLVIRRIEEQTVSALKTKTPTVRAGPSDANRANSWGKEQAEDRGSAQSLSYQRGTTVTTLQSVCKGFMAQLKQNPGKHRRNMK